MRRFTAALAIAFLGALLAGEAVSQTKKPAARGAESPALVVVNGKAITVADLERVMKTRKVPDEKRDKYRRPFLEEMVDARLVGQFLASKKVVADKKDVDAQIQNIKTLAVKSGSSPDKVIAEMGYTTESLREEFSLPLAWKKYITATLTDDKLHKYFESHREQFDGTKVRAQQILIKVASDDESEWNAAVEKLTALREEIVEGKVPFDEAAKTYSDAPSGRDGGDVGFFPYNGAMPESFSQTAFKLKVDEISEPFRSRYGVHLCQVIDRQPGKFSLEDVRNEVQARMAQDLWRKTAADMKRSAKVEWKDGL